MSTQSSSSWLLPEYLAWIGRGCPVDTTVMSLYLINAQITSIPAEIGNLRYLLRLVIRENQLTSIPAEIGNIHCLQQLDLSRNQITSIPVEIGNLHGLKELDLSHNTLTTIPTQLCHFSDDAYFDITSNPNVFVPSNVLEMLNRQIHKQQTLNHEYGCDCYYWYMTNLFAHETNTVENGG